MLILLILCGLSLCMTNVATAYLLMLVWKLSALVLTAVILSNIFSCDEEGKMMLNFSYSVAKIHKKGTWIATPKSLPSSIFGMRCWIQQETYRITQGASDRACLEKRSSIHYVWKLTTMMASLKATISGLTCSRSSMIFSLLLIKPHFGAGKKTLKSIQHYLTNIFFSKWSVTPFLLLIVIIFVRLHTLLEIMNII